MAHLAAELRAATVEVRAEGHGNGSGVIWRDDGLVITNSHVARGDDVEVVLSDGRALPGQVVDRSADFDLAAVRVSGGDLHPAPIGDSSTLRVGELVLAMGHPLGVRGALTVGIVHMVPRDANGESDERWIRADLSLPLAVPSNMVERFIAGKTRPAFLGVVTQPVRLSNGFAAQLNLGQASGLMVLSVEEGGPAARNGLLPGDILVTAGQRRLTDHEALLAVLRDHTTGTPLPLTIVRGGVPLDVTAIPGTRDSEPE
jgi:S1-C subfamily serine protease